MSATNNQTRDVGAVNDEDIDMSDIPELEKPFFESAVLTRPGESVIDALAKRDD